LIIWTIAKTTIGDAMRRKVMQVFLVIAIALIVMSLSFSQNLSFSGKEGSAVDLMLVKSFGLGLMAIAGSLMAIVMGVSLIPLEIERKTIYTILSKPVKRYEFIVGKFLGATLTLGLNIALMGIVFLIAVTLKAKGIQMAAASVSSGLKDTGIVGVQVFDINTVLGVIMIFLQFMVLSSVVMMFSTFLTQTVNFFVGTGVYILGVMSTVIQTLANADGSSKAVQWLYKGIHTIVPNFDKFNVTNTLLHPETSITSLPMYTLQVAGYAIVYTLIMAIIAVIVFDKKEV
jgi:ABC-type transport system involved in multi-copper enzyme maturation permease subunit